MTGGEKGGVKMGVLKEGVGMGTVEGGRKGM